MTLDDVSPRYQAYARDLARCAKACTTRRNELKLQHERSDFCRLTDVGRVIHYAYLEVFGNDPA